MSKYTTVLHLEGHPAQYLVPRKTIQEVSQELENCRLANKGYDIYDTDESIKGVSIHIPSWQISRVMMLTRVDLDELRKQQERANMTQKLGIAPS